MTTTLMTFLGRVSNDEGGYRKTPYVFNDGFQSEPITFFGWPLLKRTRSERCSPDLVFNPFSRTLHPMRMLLGVVLVSSTSTCTLRRIDTKKSSRYMLLGYEAARRSYVLRKSS